MREFIDIFRARILIVDDQESNIRLLQHTLRRAGYLEVTSTADAIEVCALHRKNRYDLILLDLQMPRMNGFEVIEGLRAIEGPENVAILVLTADPSQMVRALEAGASGFLGKPFVLAEALVSVKTLLQQTMYGVLCASAKKVLPAERSSPSPLPDSPRVARPARRPTIH
jgi:adenylate cyclase